LSKSGWTTITLRIGLTPFLLLNLSPPYYSFQMDWQERSI